MSLDCDSETINFTLNNTRNQLKNQIQLNKKKDDLLQEKEKVINDLQYRIKLIMDGWRKERLDYELEIQKLENIIQVPRV
tara:strand:+ start:101 stop:340 length:240 start_codon:yes stop_codon:yes gene_type:complete